MRMNDYQAEAIARELSNIRERSPFYRGKFEGIDLSKIRTQEDFETLPLTDKGDLRGAYPLGLMAAPEEEIVRVHSSSGTTGTPVVIPYTKKDIEDWATMFERCYRMAGVTETDRVQITPGYGLWTAGIGFEAGAEKLGAMAVPTGPGNTERQLRMMRDLHTTVLCATSSYALLLAEAINKQGMKDGIGLRKGIIGSERWGDKMRKRIAAELGVELYDIYGLTEIYGPGIGISCSYENGIHMWDDYLYLEVIDPKTLETVPDGTVGELVITTLTKGGAPLIRYRTHDLTRIIPGECPCGSRYPRIDIIAGRTDDMVKVKGVNMFPAQFEEALAAVPDASSEYQVMIDHLNGRDIVTLLFETGAPREKWEAIEGEVLRRFRAAVGPTIAPKAVNLGDLPRSEKKAHRIFDNRYRRSEKAHPPILLPGPGRAPGSAYGNGERLPAPAIPAPAARAFSKRLSKAPVSARCRTTIGPHGGRDPVASDIRRREGDPISAYHPNGGPVRGYEAEAAPDGAELAPDGENGASRRGCASSAIEGRRSPCEGPVPRDASVSARKVCRAEPVPVRAELRKSDARRQSASPTAVSGPHGRRLNAGSDRSVAA